MPGAPSSSTTPPPVTCKVPIITAGSSKTNRNGNPSANRQSPNLMNPRSLSGKTALITGASKGLGKAMAFALAEAGAQLILVSRDQEKLRVTAEGVRERGSTAEVWPTDVTDEVQVRNLEQRVIAGVGKIHILI